jgi:hypothetical protein
VGSLFWYNLKGPHLVLAFLLSVLGSARNKTVSDREYMKDAGKLL